MHDVLRASGQKEKCHDIEFEESRQASLGIKREMLASSRTVPSVDSGFEPGTLRPRGRVLTTRPQRPVLRKQSVYLCCTLWSYLTHGFRSTRKGARHNKDLRRKRTNPRLQKHPSTPPLDSIY
ncbi:hypothetical protein AVEN_150715-1 [Araneus ventricosus]|uniref:Uncharacterized protein n=1 Tax=Araneus ventricosus TaxID=182803 RepID=A0A4Y2UZ98_ARAVE|nr:hypothetical protein AVEN_150715-1 [Araneus ventricosus]